MPTVGLAGIPPDDALEFDDPGEVRASGINVRSGDYLAPALDAAALSAIAEGRELTAAELLEITRRRQTAAETLGVAAGIDEDDLAEAGWGIVFAADEPRTDDLLAAIEPLRALRAAQAGPFFKVFRDQDGLRPDEAGWEFLARHGAGPGPVDPSTGVPFYLLFLGDAARLPFGQQCEIDVRHAVGRLDFDHIDEVAAYAERLTLAEYGPATQVPPRALFWGTRNAGDLATQRSARHLIAPLARAFAQDHPAWQVDGFAAAAATKAALRDALHAEQPPSLLMTASHGAGYPSGDPDQREWQGALVTQEWGGPLVPGEITSNMLFGAADLDKDVRLDGLMAFLFACYGAGTPETDHFLPESVTGVSQIAPAPFTTTKDHGRPGRKDRLPLDGLHGRPQLRLARRPSGTSWPDIPAALTGPLIMLPAAERSPPNTHRNRTPNRGPAWATAGGRRRAVLPWMEAPLDITGLEAVAVDTAQYAEHLGRALSVGAAPGRDLDDHRIGLADEPGGFRVRLHIDDPRS